jgi:hypothetical protein
MDGVQMCASLRITFYILARRLGEFVGSEKHASRPVFICSRLQYSKYLTAVRVTKGDQMWQRWTPVPPI